MIVKENGEPGLHPELGYPHCVYPSKIGGIYAVIADMNELGDILEE